MMTATNDLLDDSLDKFGESLPKRSPSSAIAVIHSDEDSAIGADIDRWCSSSMDDSSSQINHSEKVKELEDEYNRLSESVLSLSTQFAHIQFRLQQISAAPTENRDELLKELLEFASEGCLDISGIREEANQLRQSNNISAADVGEKRTRVLDLIQKLRTQTEDLERFAYENGHGVIPLCELKERQKLVFDKLQEKIRLKIELEKLSGEELQQNLDQGLDEILNPIKQKDELVDQLQTQITDLERFVSFLQQESTTHEIDEAANLVGRSTQRSIESAYKRAPLQRKRSLFNFISGQSHRHFERNELKKTPIGNHYGDQRAQLELAVDKLMQVMEHRQLLSIDHDAEREELQPEELNEHISGHSDEVIVSAVRKDLSPCLKALLEHGMKNTVQTESQFAASSIAYLGLGCFSTRHAQIKRQESIGESRVLTHIWDVIVFYYEFKKAEERRDAVVGSLTETFNLDSVYGRQATSQQILMATIDNIITTHDRLRRSNDSKWKAFVSAALNRKRLPAWIRIIFRSDFVVARCYNTWSYVCRTGCEDIRPLLEGLHKFTFELPVDLAIRPFDYIKDAF
ncbi:RUN domain-containing protein [Aphelenchoides besseyi]|nr:RUN domain-containing protein [Aphelenchoides besseyi]KAI6199773.1 RUN domain-containing protein [Aphelenchoides besseyi]